MVERRYKVTAAVAALVLGVCLAWPLRKAAERPPRPVVLPSTPTNLATEAASPAESPIDRLPADIPAQPASLSFFTERQTEDSFDQQSPVTTSEPPAAEGGPRPVYLSAASATIDPAVTDSPAESPTSRVHVVHNGDTLTRLAKRYLGDEGRALEIFDLNRDQLANPHLLPIGAELTIPGAPSEE